MLAGIRKEIAEVRSEFVELRSAKERLEKMQAQGLFGFTRRVDANSFKVLCTILAEGDVAKASRALATVVAPSEAARPALRPSLGIREPKAGAAPARTQAQAGFRRLSRPGPP